MDNDNAHDATSYIRPSTTPKSIWKKAERTAAEIGSKVNSSLSSQERFDGMVTDQAMALAHRALDLGYKPTMSSVEKFIARTMKPAFSDAETYENKARRKAVLRAFFERLVFAAK